MNEGQPFLFREEQRLPPLLQLPVHAGLLIALGLFAFNAWKALPGGPPAAGNALAAAQEVAGAALGVVVMAGLAWLMRAARLETEVRADGVHARLYPLHRRFRHFRIEEIESCEAVRYRPLLEYGGFGLRWGLHGRAWNMRGNRGVRLVFSEQPRLLIGSQKPDEFVQAVNEARRRVRPGRWS